MDKLSRGDEWQALELGDEQSIGILPGWKQAAHSINGYCGEDCLSKQHRRGIDEGTMIVNFLPLIHQRQMQQGFPTTGE